MQARYEIVDTQNSITKQTDTIVIPLWVEKQNGYIANNEIPILLILMILMILMISILIYRKMQITMLK